MEQADNRELLLEQYKLFVETAESVSSRRIHANQFYLSLLTVLLGIITFALSKDSALIQAEYFVLLPVSLLGLLLCGVWYAHLESFRQLNSAKFKVIHELEAQLPYACFAKEWEFAQANEKGGFLRFTKVEKLIPLIMAVPYSVLLMYGVYALLLK